MCAHLYMAHLMGVLGSELTHVPLEVQDLLLEEHFLMRSRLRGHSSPWACGRMHMSNLCHSTATAD